MLYNISRCMSTPRWRGRDYNSGITTTTNVCFGILASVSTVDRVNEIIATAVRRSGRGAQSRLAEAVGVSLGTVSHWVHGRATPDQERWPRIEEALGLRPGSLDEAFQRSITPPSDDDTLAWMTAAFREIRDEIRELRLRVEQLEATGRPDL